MQLEKLNIPYCIIKPNIDETPQPSESPAKLAQRLSEQKAKAAMNCKAVELDVPKASPENTFVIGSDQVAINGKTIIGKPGDHATAKQQLLSASGETLQFFTGLCLINLKSKKTEHYIETTKVTFRTLSEEQIEGYLNLEQPYNCAGSFKSEGAGICLIEEIQGRDPNALIGLPLIGLLDLLLRFGIDYPNNPNK